MSLVLLKRLSTLVATLLGASIVIFLVLEVLPGNAAQMLMGPDASPEAVQALAEKLGLDQPPMLRYWAWVSGLMLGDMGNSYAYSSPVLELMLERLSLTIPLALLAMGLTTVIALAVGLCLPGLRLRSEQFVFCAKAGCTSSAPRITVNAASSAARSSRPPSWGCRAGFWPCTC